LSVHANLWIFADEHAWHNLVSKIAGMGYSGGGGVVLLNIDAYLDRLRIRVSCMSR